LYYDLRTEHVSLTLLGWALFLSWNCIWLSINNV